MSHLISGIKIQSQPILIKNPLKTIISPKYKHIIKDTLTHIHRHSQEHQHHQHVHHSHSRDRTQQHQLQSLQQQHTYRDRQSWKQQLAITNLCKKLSDKQFINLRKQNALQIQHHFSKLKGKLKKQNSSTNFSTVDKFFEPTTSQDNKLNIRQIQQRSPKKINLMHKYNNKIVNYVESVNDTYRIITDKENYKRWLDLYNNNPVKSPNYSRMSFVLERLWGSSNRGSCGDGVGCHDGGDGQRSINVNVNGKENVNLCMNMNMSMRTNITKKHSNDNSIITYEKDESYKPKLTRVRTLGNQSTKKYKLR